MIELIESSNSNVIAIKLSGKLHAEDYEHFVPMVDDAVERDGKVRMLVQFHDFHGWDIPAVWEDTKFAIKHCTKIERIAMVGDKAWEKWMAVVCKPFTMARVKYFDAAKTDEAWAWVGE